MNEVIATQETQRQELSRRAQEHQGQHLSLEQLRSRIEEINESFGILSERVDQISRSRGFGSSTMATNNEVYKRLDRWATGSTDRPFTGAEGAVGFKGVDNLDERRCRVLHGMAPTGDGEDREN